ncbi:MAG TPA: hypothetical protein VMV45_04380 [Casimicrobiaceae bacterium]|nr:hypothetical protein [Casimicrobiaceae bacterium]
MTRTPGTVEAVHTENVTATISAIDAKTRQVMLKGPQGKEFAVEAGPEVKNFAQLKVGDQVDVQYVEAVAVQLKKGGGAPVVASQQGGMVTAKPGAKPGAAAGRQVSVVGDVIDLDPATRTVTVRGPQRTASFVVEDPEQFKLIAKGDHIQATYTEAFAVAVTEAPKKK